VAASASRVGLKRNSSVFPLRIHSPVQVHPDFFDFDGGLVHFPGVVAGVEMRSATLLQFGGLLLNPAVDRGVIDVQTPFEHHLLQIAVTRANSADTSVRIKE
jgi:hypothetical protein